MDDCNVKQIVQLSVHFLQSSSTTCTLHVTEGEIRPRNIVERCVHFTEVSISYGL